MADELERNRALWSQVNEQFTAADAEARWGQAEITWGLFSILDALHELYPPADASAHDFYEIVTPEWAARWPAEELWVAHLPAR